MTPESENDIQRSLGRVEAKIDALLLAHEHSSGAIRSLDERTSSLERWQSRTLGLVAGGGAVAAAVLSLVWHIALTMK